MGNLRTLIKYTNLLDWRKISEEERQFIKDIVNKEGGIIVDSNNINELFDGTYKVPHYLLKHIYFVNYENASITNKKFINSYKYDNFEVINSKKFIESNN